MYNEYEENYIYSVFILENIRYTISKLKNNVFYVPRKFFIKTLEPLKPDFDSITNIYSSWKSYYTNADFRKLNYHNYDERTFIENIITKDSPVYLKDETGNYYGEYGLDTDKMQYFIFRILNNLIIYVLYKEIISYLKTEQAINAYTTSNEFMEYVNAQKEIEINIDNSFATVNLDANYQFLIDNIKHLKNETYNKGAGLALAAFQQIIQYANNITN